MKWKKILCKMSWFSINCEALSYEWIGTHLFDHRAYRALYRSFSSIETCVQKIESHRLRNTHFATLIVQLSLYRCLVVVNISQILFLHLNASLTGVEMQKKYLCALCLRLVFNPKIFIPFTCLQACLKFHRPLILFSQWPLILFSQSKSTWS